MYIYIYLYTEGEREREREREKKNHLRTTKNRRGRQSLGTTVLEVF